MCAPRMSTLVVLCLLAATAVGCASNTAPRGWLPSPEEAERESYGGWISVRCVESTDDCVETHGELIAVDGDSVFVLKSSTLRAIPWTSVSEATLTGYNAGTENLVVWGTLGTALTVSHGYFLAASLPIWLITSITSAAAHSHHPERKYPRDNPWQLREFARFPQGLPEGVPREALRPVPLH